MGIRACAMFCLSVIIVLFNLLFFPISIYWPHWLVSAKCEFIDFASEHEAASTTLCIQYLLIDIDRCMITAAVRVANMCP